MYGLPNWNPNEIRDPRLDQFKRIKGDKVTELQRLREHLSGCVVQYLTKSFSKHTDQAEAWRQLQGILFCIDCINKQMEEDSEGK